MNGYPRFGWVDIIRFQQKKEDYLKAQKEKSRKSCDLQDSVRRERLSNLWFLRISQNTQISVYQLFVKFVKNQDITKYLSVSLFLGVKLGVDFEITPKLRFAGYKCIHDNKKKMLASGSVPIIL